VDFGRSTDRPKRKGAVLELPEGMAGIRGARILLVDDNHLNQVFARDFLNFARLTVDLAVNGEEAVRAVKEAEEPYDAVLMDMQMPVMDGIEAARIIRQDEVNSDLPIIATTANTRREEWERCQAVGINDCLPKPFLIPDLCAMLTRWIPAGNRVPADSDKKATGENVVASESPGERKIVTEIHLPDLIDGIDTKVGLSRAVGNRRLYADLLNDFVKANAALAEEVRGAVETGDLERARFLVHGLKSTAGNIGAEDMFSTAANLEAEFVAWEDRLAGLLDTFQGKLDGVVAAIRDAEIQVHTEPRQRSKMPFDRDQARLHAEMLWKMLEHQSMGAPQQLDKLAEALGGSGCDDSLERLAASLEALEYSKAREILERVCEEFLQ
jgi:CheY-like chemotaxis protein/HPt (histidine-containing phosphotransfer) domain-containing protein